MLRLEKCLDWIITYRIILFLFLSAEDGITAKLTSYRYNRVGLDSLYETAQ